MLPLLAALALLAPADDKKPEAKKEPTKFEKAWKEAEDNFKKLVEAEPEASKKRTKNDIEATIAYRMKDEELWLGYEALSKAGLKELVTAKSGEAMSDKQFREVMEKLHDSPKVPDLMTYAFRWSIASPTVRGLAAKSIIGDEPSAGAEVTALIRALKK